MAESDEDKCAEALALARSYIKRKAPYVSRTLYGLVPYSAPGIGTLGVSERLILVVDPGWFIKLPLIQQASCLMHEISHVVRDQSRIRAMPNHDLANIAFDLPINYDLREGGWELPFGYYPESFDFPVGLTGEQYYELLEKEQQSNPKIGKILSNTNRGVAQGKCGSCAGNPVDKKLEEILGQEFGRTGNDIEHIRNVTAQDIRNYQSKGRGTIPGVLTQWLPDPPEPKVRTIRWRDKLMYIIRHATGRAMSGRTDYSYRRLSRRSFMAGTIKPGMISRMPTVAFAEDTSGSMGASQTFEARGQAVDVMLQLGIERAWWIQADAAVSATPKQLSLREIKALGVTGRGGTNFGPAIAAAQLLRPRPDILIYLTDGDGSAPEQPPANMEVIFCVVPGHFNQAPVDWGHTIIIQDEVA